MEGKKKKKKKTKRFFPPPGSFFLPRSRERLFDYENENEFETSCMRNDLTSISSGWGEKKHANDNHIMGLKEAQII